MSQPEKEQAYVLRNIQCCGAEQVAKDQAARMQALYDRETPILDQILEEIDKLGFAEREIEKITGRISGTPFCSFGDRGNSIKNRTANLH